MRHVFLPLLLLIGVCATLVIPAEAASQAQQCKQACSSLINTCVAASGASGFGNLARACKRAVRKRCRQEGVDACKTFCGNGTVDRSEACDGSVLAGMTCTGLGFASGTLRCTAACGFDTSACMPFPAPTCGNGTIEAPEQCDGAALGGTTCGSLGFLGGTLACTAGCGFNTSGCMPSAAPTCGNGTIDGPEQCDGMALGGATCGSLGFNAFEGTLACTAGCGFDTSGCVRWRFPETGQKDPYMADKNDGIPGPVAVPDDGTLEAGQSLEYVDNGDGTITDRTTGLMWEQKDHGDGVGNPVNLHDVDNTYVWSGDGTQQTIWDWLEDVNAEGGTGFAGHSDWRIPNVKELQSLVSYGRHDPAIEPVFHTACDANCDVAMGPCGCTRNSGYWSGTTYATDPMHGFDVNFPEGGVYVGAKGVSFPVRAVRGGS